ncbi:MAG TPA: Piwi domain-containing protein [Sphingobacteriaceae bacterium]|nr:Piwi domain-containing protein [Sphingobacteriaceae bacterium]
MANIRLNILPVSESDFSFKVFRKLKQEDDTKEDNIYFYHLPEDSDLTKRKGYWVSFIPRQGFEEFENHSFYAIGLTKRFLTEQLLNTLTKNGCPIPYNVSIRFTEEKVEFTLHEFTKGKQIIYLSPFYFEEQRRFGFIIDFRFSRNKELLFDKEVQILSLSLDSQGRSNKNYYSDKFRLIQSFLDKVFDNIQKIREGENNLLHIEKELIETPVFQLNKKEYIFSNKSTANSQFQGIRNYGPLHKIDKEVLFVFIFEDRFKSFANELYLSLTGKSNPGTFPGFEQMFGVIINTSNVKQIKIEGFSNDQLLSIVDKVKAYQEAEPNKKVIGIYIEDYSTDTEDIIASNHYYFMKYNFIKNNLPLQVVNYRKLSEKNSLKWSTSNVALAMFAKMGGIPWVVKPSNINCLILGVGSSHKRNEETGEITKYFAYTVCLDSSGLYKTLEVLADETSETNYLQKLKSNLIKLLKDGRMSDYKTCVLHLPFKIKQNEITAISEAIKQVDDIEFVAIKVNLDNKYFGYSFHNTFVPYESSFVKLSRSEYLVWFEGLLYGKEVVDKRLANPVHIQFLNLGNQKGFDERKYLQDVLNLSGANWRGFNAKSIPISIYYSQIIAKYSEAFEKIDGYEENSISNDKPWFL